MGENQLLITKRYNLAAISAYRKGRIVNIVHFLMKREKLNSKDSLKLLILIVIITL